MEDEIIVGLHSIAEALKNRRREHHKLYLTQEGLAELQSRGITRDQLKQTCEYQVLKAGDVQRNAQDLYNKKKFTYKRVAGNMLLLAAPLPTPSPSDLYNALDDGSVTKILSLDQVTDVNNAAAILRTACFYGAHYMIFARKGNFAPTPSFYRVAAGATEHLETLVVGSLPRVLSKIKDKGIPVIGMTEDGSQQLGEADPNAPTCLVLGAEDKGLSNAVRRATTSLASLPAVGAIKSVNVSVAAAIAMEKAWGSSPL